MDTELLTQALKGDTELFHELLDHFPYELISEEVSLLSQEYQAKFRELEEERRRQHSPTFNPDNPHYDLSLLKDGDRVTCQHSPELGIGTVEIRQIKAPNFSHSVVMVHFDCGKTESYYPNQLIRA